MERLIYNCDPYKKQDGKYNPNYITKLVQNYRSHKSLLYLSNKQFYDEELKICGGAETQMALNWSQLPNKNFPMIFQEVRGTEEKFVTKRLIYLSIIYLIYKFHYICLKAELNFFNLFAKLHKHKCNTFAVSLTRSKYWQY